MSKINVPDDVKKILEEFEEGPSIDIRLGDDAYVKVFLPDGKYFELNGPDCSKALGSIDSIYTLHEALHVEPGEAKLTLHDVELDEDLLEAVQDCFEI